MNEEKSNPYGWHLLAFFVLLVAGPLFVSDFDSRAGTALAMAAGVVFYLTWFLYSQWNRENRPPES